MVDAEIIAYYTRGLEQDRLAAGPQRVEFLRIQDLLARFLPAAPAKVLDVGGGAGVHAIPLAAAGYEVHLIDPVPLHVEQARAASHAASRPLASAAVGDARDLGAAGTGFDAVLLLGPLYHLTSRADRVTALREARRAARPGDTELTKDALQSAKEETSSVLKELGEGPRPASVTVKAAAGLPAAELLMEAADADMVVVGARGAGGFKRLMMGSVSTQVVHHAHCPVVVIPADRT